MIVYNVTTILDEEIHTDWLNWMNSEHIADVMSSNCFVESRLLKILDSPNEGVTYCAQYTAENLAKYQEYKEKFAPALQAAFPERFANKFVIYRSVMEVIA